MKNDTHKRWMETLDAAKRRPGMFIGDPNTAHICAISDVLDLIWQVDIFEHPSFVSVKISPNQYRITCNSGPLLSEIGKLVDWQGDVLIESFAHPRSALRSKLANTKWQKYFKSADGPDLTNLVAPFYLASFSIIGIKTAGGVWCQSFKNGWPISEPLQIQSNSGRSLMLTAHLSKDWFTSLPFDQDDLQRIVPIKLKPKIAIEWQDDDLLISDGMFTNGDCTTFFEN